MTVVPLPKEVDLPRLSPRQRETLQRLMQGDSEKQAAVALGISISTLHCHVKQIYRTFQVSSRGELFAKCYRHLAELRGPDGAHGQMRSRQKSWLQRA